MIYEIAEREIERGGVVLCRSCAGDSYYALPVVTAVSRSLSRIIYVDNGRYI
ncbi:MAG: hypothetical protein GWP17_06075 [Aquificales bacterium]|nr:hypothetical protein [Aquificales bacterium]